MRIDMSLEMHGFEFNDKNIVIVFFDVHRSSLFMFIRFPATFVSFFGLFFSL